MRVLVGYGSRYGTTQEVAEAIAKECEAQGDEVRCVDAKEIDSLDGFDAVIVGSGLYAGRMRLRSRKLIRWATDGGVPLAVFALGPLDHATEHWDEARRQLDHEIARAPGASPVAVTLFGGCLDPEHMHFPFSRMEQVDLRDWDAIATWAADARAQLASVAAATA